MSYYKAGMVIKLMREACGMTQEELAAENICSVNTLSRIENGTTSVKRKTYQLLMERMGRFSEKNYAICAGKDLKAMEYKELIDEAMRMYRYEEAQKYLELFRLEKITSIPHKQYLIKTQAIIMSELKKISHEECIRRLENALGLTVPRFREYKNKIYPYTMTELEILMNIGNQRLENKELQKAIEIYDSILKSLGKDYMSIYDAIHIKIIINYNRMKVFHELKQFKKSYEAGEEILKLCRKNVDTIIVPCVLGEIAEIIREGIEAGEFEISYKEKIISYLQMSYYIAFANKDDIVKKISLKKIKEYYNENVVTTGYSEPSDNGVTEV